MKLKERLSQQQFLDVLRSWLARLCLRGPVSAQVQESWVAVYDGQGINGDIATAIAFDFLGNVYVTGRSDSSGEGGRIDPEADYDYVTIKYDIDGNLLQKMLYHG